MPNLCAGVAAIRQELPLKPSPEKLYTRTSAIEGLRCRCAVKFMQEYAKMRLRLSAFDFEFEGLHYRIYQELFTSFFDQYFGRTLVSSFNI